MCAGPKRVGEYFCSGSITVVSACQRKGGNAGYLVSKEDSVVCWNDDAPGSIKSG